MHAQFSFAVATDMTLSVFVAICIITVAGPLLQLPVVFHFGIKLDFKQSRPAFEDVDWHGFFALCSGFGYCSEM